MKRGLCACLFVLGCTYSLAAKGPSLPDARQRLLRGHYEEARALYEALAKDVKLRVPAVIGLSRVLESKGEYAKALDAVEKAAKEEPRSPELLARQGELLYLLGRWEDALKAAESALTLNADSFAARWVRAQVYRDRGDVQKADAEFRWFVRTYTERSNNDKDIKDPEELLLVALAGAENARWNRIADQFNFIVNEVLGDAIKLDKDFWPAEHLAGMLFLEKYARGYALDAFDKALKINPNAAEVLTGKGVAAFQKMDQKEAELLVDRALKINPSLPEARRLRANIDLMGGDFARAITELERARKINARDENTLGRLAACYYLSRQKPAFDTLCLEVEARDPKAGVFYAELAECLDERRRFDDAEPYYKKAAELRPQLPGPRAARPALHAHGERGGGPTHPRRSVQVGPVQRARQEQPARPSAPGEVQDPSDGALRATLRSGPRRRTGGIHGRLPGKHLRGAGGPVRLQAARRILVEVFNSHEMFSGRVVSLPDLHTIGACTGRIFAMVSPRGQGVAHPFNWTRVLRHELVHIFNLEQTHFLVPHWLTEGLAVINEGFPRPQVWNELLLERVPVKRLKTLENIDLGFMRPDSPADWAMAYCQSQLYVEYLKKRFGKEAVGDLLAAYGDSLDTPAAIRKVCKVSPADFESGYLAYVEEVVKGLKSQPAEKALGFRELREAHAKDPENLNLAAQLAEQLLRRRDRAEARRLADAVLAKQPKHQLASYVKASLLRASGQDKEALALLEGVLDEKNPEPKVLQELAKLYFENKQPDKAARMYELGRQAEPYDRKWLEGLARVYAETGDRAKQIGVLKELVPTDADDLENRRRLALLCLETGQHADAEVYARQTLEIDVLDKSAQDTLLAALRGQSKSDEAARFAKLFGK